MMNNLKEIMQTQQKNRVIEHLKKYFLVEKDNNSFFIAYFFMRRELLSKI